MFILSSSKLLAASFTLAMLSASPSFAALESRQNVIQSISSIDQAVIANQENRTFRVIAIEGNQNILIKSLGSGKRYSIYYTSKIGADVDDLVTITFSGDTWVTVINNRTGKSAAITSVYNRY